MVPAGRSPGDYPVTMTGYDWIASQLWGTRRGSLNLGPPGRTGDHCDRPVGGVSHVGIQSSPDAGPGGSIPAGPTLYLPPLVSLCLRVSRRAPTSTHSRNLCLQGLRTRKGSPPQDLVGLED